jgi:predicted phosphoadenosine phosphosulfate sulfurtransferase
MNRQRTMLKANGYQHYKWSTACKSEGSYRFYPIFDWQFRDVWKYIADTGVRYNRLYDRMYARGGINLRTMRVSNLVHEQAFRSLAQIQEFEPETFDRLVARLRGVHCAAMYAEEDFVFSVDHLPDQFSTWRSYRDYLLATTPLSKRSRYLKRFAKQGDEESMCRHQVKQLLLNDWEGKLPNTRQSASKLRKLWWDKL